MKNKITKMFLFFLIISNLFLSGFIYFRFKCYEKVFKVNKIMSESYQLNHRYEPGKIYKIINHTSDLPNGYRSYVVQGVSFVDDIFIPEEVVREIDVPEDSMNYITVKDNVNGAKPVFLTVVNVDGEEKTLLFNCSDSMIFFTKQ